jgi:hypothetical protein
MQSIVHTHVAHATVAHISSRLSTESEPCIHMFVQPQALQYHGPMHALCS